MNNNEIMLDYSRIFDHKSINAELKRRGCKTRNFTKAFLQMYVKARQDIQTNTAAGIDTTYYCTEFNGWTRHEYDEIRQTAFYRVESGSYCEFLSIAYEIETKAREHAERENEYKCA